MTKGNGAHADHIGAQLDDDRRGRFSRARRGQAMGSGLDEGRKTESIAFLFRTPAEDNSAD